MHSSIYDIGMHAFAVVHIWKSEDSLQESILSFDQTGSVDWTQIIWLSSKCFYWLQSSLWPQNTYMFEIIPWLKLLESPIIMNYLKLAQTDDH